MKHLLVIAYEFPPYAGSGVFRIVKFVKYLSQFGWRCTVLTVAFDADALSMRDEALLEQLPSGTKIVRAKCLDPFMLYRRLGGTRKERSQMEKTESHGTFEYVAGIAQRLFDATVIPDAKVGWYPGGVRSGSEIISADRPDAIFSTSPRETAHLIAMKLAKRYHIPWVADFRDPWSKAFFRTKIFPFKQIDAWLECRTIRAASAYTVAWPGLSRMLTECVPTLRRDRVHTITNGYDPDDFKGVKPIKRQGFNIVYTGIFIPKYRTPEPLLKAIAIWFKQDPTVSEQVKVTIVGPIFTFIHELVAHYGLKTSVKIVPPVSHDDALRYALGADCLFFTNSFGTEANSSQVPAQDFIPGKLFDYLGTERPILALAQPGSASGQILRDAPQAMVIGSLDAEAILTALRRIFARWKSGDVDRDKGKMAGFSKYHRRNLTQKLAEILDSIRCI